MLLHHHLFILPCIEVLPLYLFTRVALASSITSSSPNTLLIFSSRLRLYTSFRTPLRPTVSPPPLPAHFSYSHRGFASIPPSKHRFGQQYHHFPSTPPSERRLYQSKTESRGPNATRPVLNERPPALQRQLWCYTLLRNSKYQTRADDGGERNTSTLMTVENVKPTR